MLKSGSVINKRIFNSIALSFLIFRIFLIAILITIPIILILLLIRFLYIYHRVTFYLSLPFSSSLSSSLSSSFFLILLINVRVHAFCKGLYLRTPKPELKALIYFKDIGFKAVLGVSNKVLSRAKHAFAFSAY